MKTIKAYNPEYQVEVSRPNRIRSFGILLLLLFIFLSTQGCGAWGGTKQENAEMTAEAELTATQIFQSVQETLGILASETALAMPPSSTTLPPSPFPTFTSTSIPATLTFTDTPLPSATIPPTSTNTPLIPTATSILYFDEVDFRQGGTSAYFQNTIGTGELHSYTLWAKEGQTLILNVSSPNNDVYLDVIGRQDGQQLLWSGYQASYWSGRLSKSQDYLITLTTFNPDTYYFLSVEIPANIYFDPGAYSDKLEGYIDVDQVFHPEVLTRVRYLAFASAGQKMTVKLSSPNLNALSLGIVGQADGKVYLNYEVKNSEGEVKLPSTQGYYIDVYSVNGKSTDFTIKVSIR